MARIIRYGGFLLFLLGMALLAGAAGAQPPLAIASWNPIPTPLPNDCTGVSPHPTPPPVCCAFGYVFVDGIPVTSAEVTIQSATGQLTVYTASGPLSDRPYYRVDLSSDPLRVQPGDTITVMAAYAGRSGRVTQVAVGGGQQIDVIPTVAGVDLLVQGIAVDPPNPDVNQPVTITMTIQNQGDTNTSSGFRTYLYPPGSPPYGNHSGDQPHLHLRAERRHVL